MNCHAGVTVALWADREAGQYLKDMQDSNERQKQGGDRKSNSQNESLIYTPTLEDLDIDYNESSRWQLMAEIPEEDFIDYIDEKIAKGYEYYHKEPTGNIVLPVDQ